MQYLTHLNAIKDEELLLIEVEGYTNHGYPGIPKLAPVAGTHNMSKDRMLELDFINQYVEDDRLIDIEFKLKTIIDLRKFKRGIVGVKVYAQNNTDIALLA